MIPFDHGTLRILLNAFGNVIRIHQAITDEQRIPFHGFGVLENDVFQFAVLYVHHARKIVGERGSLFSVFGQMLFQPPW
jgi:hypothetical protein